MATLASLMVKLGLDPKQLRSGAAKARKYIQGVQSDVERTHAWLAKLEAPVSALGKVGGLAVVAQGALAAKAAVAPLAGALLALPAAAGGAAGAMATVKMATAGVGDAMQALASGDAAAAQEAMAKLSPAARSFVRGMQGTREAFKPVQQAVQQKFFDGLGKQVSALAKGHLPGLRKGLGDTATQLNGLAKEGIAAAGTPFMRGVVADTLDRTARIIGLFRPAAGPMVTALGAMVKAGMPLVEQFAAWAAAGLTARATFLGTAEGATWLEQKVNTARVTIGQLVAIAGNVRAIMAGLFDPATAGGTNLLAVLEVLTGRMAAWVNSAAGQEKIAEVWSLISDTGRMVAETLPLMLGPLGVLLRLLTSMDPATRAVVVSIAAWAVVLGPVIGKVTMLVSALVQIWRAVPAIWALAKAMGSGITTAARWVAAHSAAAARTTAAWVVSSARTVAALTVAGAAFVAQRSVILASMAATAAGVVAGWVVMGAQSLANAARMAAAWVIAMGPVGWVIAAVIGLVALIVANWDRISAFTSKIWSTISDAVKAAVGWLVDAVKNGVQRAISFFEWLGSLPGRALDWFGGVARGAGQKIGELVQWFVGLPGRILGALGDLGGLLLNGGMDLIRGLIRGIGNAAGWLWDKLVGIVSDAWNGVLDFLGIASPSKQGRWAGQMLGLGMAKGIDGMAGAVAAASARLATAATIEPADVDIPAPRVPGLAMAGATGGAAGGDRRLVSIEHFHATPAQSPSSIATELDWRSRSGGR